MRNQDEQELPLFDLAASLREKQEGMEAAADAAMSPLQQAREIALRMTRLGDEITSDHVSIELDKRGLQSNLGPAAGSLFKTDDWVFTGERQPSSRVSNHGRELKVWRRISFMNADVDAQIPAPTKPESITD